MISCGHVFYDSGCGGCEFRAQRADDQAERERHHAEDQRERERHHKERLKAHEKSRQPQLGGYAPAPRQSGGHGGGGFSLESAGVLFGIFVACVLYVITSTIVFAIVPLAAVAAVAALVAKHGLHKTLPGRFDALPVYWWASVIVIAVVDKVFRSHPAPFDEPIVNVTNLGLFLLTMAAGYALFVVYRRTPAADDR